MAGLVSEQAVQGIPGSFLDLFTGPAVGLVTHLVAIATEHTVQDAGLLILAGRRGGHPAHVEVQLALGRLEQGR